MKYLIVVDMQNDFIDGALGTKEAEAIVPYVKSVIENFDGKVIFTRDTHFEDYTETQEGHNLPVEHMKNVLEARDRRKAGQTVSPYGLTLVKVEY